MVFYATFNNISVISWRFIQVDNYMKIHKYLYFPHQMLLKLALNTNQSINQYSVNSYSSRWTSYCNYSIGGVMVSVLASSVVFSGFEPRSGQTIDYQISICCFSAKHVSLRRKSKDWLARNQNNVSEWSDMSIHEMLFQWASTIKIQLSVLV
jgi:hypothetical protein